MGHWVNPKPFATSPLQVCNYQGPSRSVSLTADCVLIAVGVSGISDDPGNPGGGLLSPVYQWTVPKLRELSGLAQHHTAHRPPAQPGSAAGAPALTRSHCFYEKL